RPRRRSLVLLAHPAVAAHATLPRSGHDRTHATAHRRSPGGGRRTRDPPGMGTSRQNLAPTPPRRDRRRRRQLLRPRRRRLERAARGVPLPRRRRLLLARPRRRPRTPRLASLLPRQSRQGPRPQHDHAAAREEPLFFDRPLARPQDRRVLRRPTTRMVPLEGPHPRAVPERRRMGPRHFRR